MIIRRNDVRRGEENGGRREWLYYSDAGGLTQYGAYLETLHPNESSSERHWHEKEDEFLIVLSGEATVVEDDGEHVLQAGDAACWAAGVANGHRVVNRSTAPCSYLIVGTGVTVEGRYVYRWEGSRPSTVLLSTPFPVDDAHPWPTTVSITCEGLPLPSRRVGERIWFLVPVVPRHATVVDLRYVQARRDATFTYVLETTRSWRRPVHSAEFVVVAPEARDVRANLPLERREDGSWAATFADLWPSADLRISLDGGG